MKKLLPLMVLFLPMLASAQPTANFVQVPVIATSPAIPSSCTSLAAVFSINITEMTTQNNIVTIYTAAPWSPTTAQLAQLASLIELGQPLTASVTPSSATVTAGGNMTFTATTNASSGPNGGPTFQWQFAGTPIIGATNATLTLTSVQSANAGNYSVVVTNFGVTATSANATLTVNSP